jgi:Large polyvalent protein-associated domain 7
VAVQATSRQAPKRHREPSGDEDTRSAELNSIRPARVRGRARNPEENAAAGSERQVPRTSIDSLKVRERFVQDGSGFYGHDGVLAFRDHGRRLSTPLENLEVILVLIAVARDRDWREIAVEGTEVFKRDAWRQGRLAGLEVRGYRPSAAEHADVIRALADVERGRQAGHKVPPSPVRNDDDHPEEKGALASDGPVLQEAGRVEFLGARKRAATILRDPKCEPAEGVRQYPELVGAYLRIRAAELVAIRLLDDPEVRRKFVQGVRDALADSVGRGEPIRQVRVRGSKSSGHPVDPD